MVAASGRSVPVTGRLAFLATTLNAICPGALRRIFTLTMRTPSIPVGLRHDQAVGRATQPIPLASFKPGGMVTSRSDAPSPLARRKRTPFSCGRSGGTIGAGMTAMAFTLRVSSSGGGSSRVSVSRGFNASVALTHGSIRSQRPSASASGQGSVVEVDDVVVLLVLVEVTTVDDVLLEVVLDEDVEVLVVEELLLEVVLEVDVVVTLAEVLVLDDVVVLVLLLVLVELLVLVDVLVEVDDVEVEVVVVDELLVLVVVPPALLMTMLSNTVPALSMPSSVRTSL